MSEMTKQGYSYDFDMFSEQGREKELKRLLKEPIRWANQRYIKRWVY